MNPEDSNSARSTAMQLTEVPLVDQSDGGFFAQQYCAKEFAAQAERFYRAKLGKRPQTPALCPKPPFPLKPEIEQKVFVACSSEWKQGQVTVLSYPRRPRSG